MKTKIILKISIALTFITFIFGSCTKDKKDNLYHVLIMEYAKDAPPMDEVINEILHFKDIPSVIDVKIGLIKANKKNKLTNFSHCIVMTFENEEGLEAYLIDPYHEKIYAKHKPFIEAIYTADFNPLSLKE